MATGLGAIRGPPLLTRIDFAPSIFAPSSHFLATSTPALRFSASGSQMSRGALLEMCWHFVPVAAILFAILSSHCLPEALEGSNSRVERRTVPIIIGTCTYMLSSVTSPNRPEKRSMWVMPGNVSLVNCGKSSMVSSPYFFFISSFFGFDLAFCPLCRVLKM